VILYFQQLLLRVVAVVVLMLEVHQELDYLAVQVVVAVIELLKANAWVVLELLIKVLLAQQARRIKDPQVVVVVLERRQQMLMVQQV
jgi:hypothetical protein